MTTKLEQIESLIVESLSREDRDALRRWLDEYAWEEWDQQINHDIRAGKHDDIIARALADDAAGLSEPL